jgi:excinuclease UvrABC ATPase subunit
MYHWQRPLFTQDAIMSKKSGSAAVEAIVLRGARQNNLKNLSLDLPVNQLIVITGVSGSGKSTLAFDTIYAEGQRRYVETFSAYARQFLDRMDKPAVDSIEGIPPAIAIDQTNPVRTSRSTVGTMTELNDYIKLVYARLSHLHCPGCQREVRRDTTQSILADLYNMWQPIRACTSACRSQCRITSLSKKWCNGWLSKVTHEFSRDQEIRCTPYRIACV